ncbi:MAG: winged helix-turn-helix transcriptional regulator [Nitrospira sp.]|nr:winged helix-turn-helix transcriptional regulator [Nitrospira sp.]MBP6604586.1 winged helix-turn-helix transcriptional regulator [Nitrospira sp.]
MYIFAMKGSTVRNPTRAAELFHALADQTRLEILDELKEGECCVCELTDRLQAGQSRLSFHLKVLKDAGMIVDRREGRWMYYAVNAAALVELDELVDSFKQARRARRTSGCC